MFIPWLTSPQRPSLTAVLPVHGLLQGARRAQRPPAAHRGGEAPRRHGGQVHFPPSAFHMLDSTASIENQNHLCTTTISKNTKHPAPGTTRWRYRGTARSWASPCTCSCRWWPPWPRWTSAASSGPTSSSRARTSGRPRTTRRATRSTPVRFWRVLYGLTWVCGPIHPLHPH